MEHAVIEIRHPDGTFEISYQEHEVDWYPKGCIIKLFSHSVTAKSRLAATREEAIKASWHFLQEDIKVSAAPWTFIKSLQHRTTKEEV